MEILKIREHPGLAQRAAVWFHEKWRIPQQAYDESIAQCLAGSRPVPQWYLAVEAGEILGGLGLIENGFHQRKDLTPNVCAVYVEPAHRRRGIAGQLLRTVCRDMADLGVDTLGISE